MKWINEKQFFIILIIITISIISTKPIHAKYRYHPEGCEFSVEFPGEPKFEKIIIPDFGEITQAQYIYGKTPKDSFLLRAEGFAVNKNMYKTINNKEYLIKMIRNYAESNGIQNVEYKYFEDKKGKKVTMRGFKKISDIYVTYYAMALMGKSSIIILYAGSASEIYPSDKITRFFKSIE